MLSSAESTHIYLVAQQPVVLNVGRHAAVVHRELAQRRLHPVKAGRLPDKVDHEVAGAVVGHALVHLELDAHLKKINIKKR